MAQRSLGFSNTGRSAKIKGARKERELRSSSNQTIILQT